MPAYGRLLFAAALLLWPAVAPAQDEEPQIDCANAVAQMELNYCAHEEYRTADAELNAAYREAMKAMERTDADLRELGEHYVGAADALRRAQRAWIGYRDGQCELAGFEARGGSMEPMLVSGCLAEMTRKRTQELKALYADTEN